MTPSVRRAILALLVVGLLAMPAAAALTDQLKQGTPDLKSVGPLAFGPEGILFVGDPAGAAVFAIATEDAAGKPGKYEIANVDEKIASLLGTEKAQLQLRDIAVNPMSGKTYVSVMRGRGADAAPVIVRTDASGKFEEFSVKSVKFGKAALKGATDRNRQEAITDMAFVDGRLIVAGLSNEDFASRLRSIPFPFAEGDTGAGIEIYHGAHGKFETNSPIRTFVTYQIGGEAQLLAAYTCTPLVRIPVSELKAGAKVKGTTVAELGNRNRPLDMIVYQKGGKDYLLMANSARGVMKIPTDGIGKAEGITNPVRGGTGKAGVGYETIDGLEGVEQLEKLDATHALLLVKGKDGSMTLKSMEMP